MNSKYRTNKLRDILSYFAKKNLSGVYQFLYNLRNWYRIKRQSWFPYKYHKGKYPELFLNNDFEPFNGIESKIDKVIYCFWTGDNEMSDNRKRGYHSLKENSGVDVKLITPKNLNEYLLPDYPLHPAYEYLSLVHKSDYLRCYFMHFHGGGYSDIKPNYKNWQNSFEKLINSEDFYILGYTELDGLGMGRGQGKIDKDLMKNYLSCVGTGAFICKSNTKFTSEWYQELNKRMDYHFENLKKCPGDIKGRNEGYPISLLSILSQIFAPLCLKFKDKIIHDNTVLPELTNYQ